jgi:hypothetical protein
LAGAGLVVLLVGTYAHWVKVGGSRRIVLVLAFAGSGIAAFVACLAGVLMPVFSLPAVVE